MAAHHKLSLEANYHTYKWYICHPYPWKTKEMSYCLICLGVTACPKYTQRNWHYKWKDRLITKVLFSHGEVGEGLRVNKINRLDFFVLLELLFTMIEFPLFRDSYGPSNPSVPQWHWIAFICYDQIKYDSGIFALHDLPLFDIKLSQNSEWK